jgi:hypothetical protein
VPDEVRYRVPQQNGSTIDRNYDLNGDGELSKEERKRMKEIKKAERKRQRELAKAERKRDKEQRKAMRERGRDRDDD